MNWKNDELKIFNIWKIHTYREKILKDLKSSHTQRLHKINNIFKFSINISRNLMIYEYHSIVFFHTKIFVVGLIWFDLIRLLSSMTNQPIEWMNEWMILLFYWFSFLVCHSNIIISSFWVTKIVVFWWWWWKQTPQQTRIIIKIMLYYEMTSREKKKKKEKSIRGLFCGLIFRW